VDAVPERGMSVRRALGETVGALRHALGRYPLALAAWTLRPRNARDMRYRP
jgi:hypothetical protein